MAKYQYGTSPRKLEPDFIPNRTSKKSQELERERKEKIKKEAKERAKQKRAAVLLKKACNIKSGSGVPNKNKVATISKAKIQEIAEMKMPDLNAASLEAAMSMIAGTARSMGIKVEE